jgi:hypothetical protein
MLRGAAAGHPKLTPQGKRGDRPCKFHSNYDGWGAGSICGVSEPGSSLFVPEANIERFAAVLLD